MIIKIYINRIKLITETIKKINQKYKKNFQFKETSWSILYLGTVPRVKIAKMHKNKIFNSSKEYGIIYIYI